MFRAALIGGVLLLATACGPLHQLPAAQSTPLRHTPPHGTIPWLPLPADLTPIPEPTPQAAPVPPGTPACTAAALAGVAEASEGATGHIVTFLAFAGTGKSNCFVDGTPALTAFDAGGHTIPFAQRAPYFPPLVTGPQLISPGPLPDPHASLKYGQAGFQIDWVSQPELCPGQSGVSVAGVRVAIPGGGVLTLALAAAPAAYVCQGLGVGNFESPPLPTVVVPAQPMPAVTLGIQSGAYAGREFEYLVTLTNDSDQALDFATTCPNYEEEFFADIVNGSPPLGGKHLYRLNCAAAHALAPGEHEIFQMIFSVPAGTTPGTYTLVFAMGFKNVMTRSVQRAVVVLASA